MEERVAIRLAAGGEHGAVHLHLQQPRRDGLADAGPVRPLRPRATMLRAELPGQPAVLPLLADHPAGFEDARYKRCAENATNSRISPE